MISRFSRIGRTWLKSAATTATASALVLGGGVAAASAAPEDDGGHGGGDGGDGGGACEFFLDHMWANEDGIPLLGSFTHLNNMHTDPAYENLVLSLASGAIGNSDMPVVDIYGGPLGWIPIFNPSHVKGHGTDYVTLLTTCGGVGVPLDTNDLTSLNVDSVEELTNLSDMIMPGLPSPDMLTDPDYIWETTDASAILQRLTPEKLTNLEEYVGFAGDHVSTWRLLWETALEDVSNGNPTGVLDVLQITENINTLESLSEVVGEDALAGVLDGDAVSGAIGGGSAGDGSDALTGVLDQEALTDLFGEDALAGVLDGGSSDSSGDGLLGGLTGGLTGGLEDTLGGLGGGLLGGDGGSDSGGAVTGSEYTVGLSGASGFGQGQATLTGRQLTITLLYAGMTSEVTSATLNTGAGELELTTTGGTSGGAGGSFELTDAQIEALESGEFSVTVSTSGSGGIGGTVAPVS
ncbi:hypothetical protein [Nesterenkonia sp. F]|uniref:hypothetical protein n=1 Tax=Nesterenkonia sp. F TaxID=795955 RepID=UPI000255D16B|nr:hypothetical protein [Nesterenkonia sp. F]